MGRKPGGENFDVLKPAMHRRNLFPNKQKGVRLLLMQDLLELFIHFNAFLRVELTPVSFRESRRPEDFYN